MDWEPIAGPSSAQPVAGPSDAQSSAPIDLTMSSLPDDAQSAWPTHYPATQQSRQPLEQLSSKDDLPILKPLPPLLRFLLDTTITIRNQLLGNLDDWSLVRAIANPNIANAKCNLLVQELHAHTCHGVLRLLPGEIDVTSLPSSSALSTIGAEDKLIDFSPVPPQLQLTAERHHETLLKVRESTYVAIKDVQGKSEDIKGKGKATREEPTMTSIKIPRTTLNPTGACQRLTSNHLLPPAPREEVTLKRGATVAKLNAQDQLRSTFFIPSANKARKLKDAIVVLYNVYVRMRGKMKKLHFNAANKDVVAASAMFDGEASESAKRRFRKIITQL
ncbi:uncharacterized protein JCM10292_003331 [Rhodotorula paludigena]|uniref:uncharacterized protein n=1 Tax=Rhodotorula paludigena TaxID=86838 RepID=UPI0031710D96